MMPMMVMSKPKKASNFLRPAEEGTRSSDWLIVDFSLLKMLLKHRKQQPTVFVQEKEEKRVNDGDEDSGPQRNPVRTNTHALNH